ncbi:MAG: flagellar motor switch protein FliM, partial [bacterium]
ILTQEEIDALLSAVGDKVRGDRTLQGKKIQRYDFKHPERISKDQLRTLRTIHDNFSRILATQLSTSLRVLVEVNLLSIDQAIFSEFTLSIRVPTALYVLDLEKVGSKALIEISPSFLLYASDRLLGGYGEVGMEPRELTMVEQNVLQKIITLIITQLEEAWSPLQPLGARISTYESDPQFVQIARASDVLAVIHFEIHLRNVSFPFNVVFPYFILDQILTQVSAQMMFAQATRLPSAEEKRSIREKILAGKLPIRVVLAQTSLKVRDFVELERENIIQLEKTTQQPVEVYIGERLKFFAQPGKWKKRRAVIVTRAITPQEILAYE